MRDKILLLSAVICLLALPVSAVEYSDLRPAAPLRMPAKDFGRVLLHGPESFDQFGARDVWVYEDNGRYYMHYDAAGPKGWLVGLAESDNLTSWTKKGTVLDLGTSGSMDSASASYGTTFKAADDQWHMFYLGTPNTTPPPDRIPAFPYTTMKATAPGPAGPWTKTAGLVPFFPQKDTYYEDSASPGFIVKQGDEYLQFFSASRSDEKKMRRTIGLARTKNLNAPWTVDAHPILPLEEQIENSSLYYEPANQTWFLFTNHIGINKNGGEYTDAIWVYWTTDLNYWDGRKKAVVLDGENCTWASRCIGLPSVVKHGDKLALFYDAPKGESTSHMARDIGLAWLDLPLQPPVDRPDTNPAVTHGLDVRALKGKVIVTPGSALVDGKTVTVKTTATLEVKAGDRAIVTNEAQTLPEVASASWKPGEGALQALKTTTMIPGALLPGSVKITRTDGTPLSINKDYTLDEAWGKIGLAKGADNLTSVTPVMASYTYGLLRVDGIDLRTDGQIEWVKGEAAFVCPDVPPVSTGSLRLATVYRPYGARDEVETWQIFPIGKPFPEPDAAEMERRGKSVEKTLKKLQAGEPVTIVTWGDSVTVGGDVSKPEFAYANLFIASLKERFPKADIKYINAGIGGSSTNDRLPNIEKEVLDFKPDLVTIEFVNDMNLPESVIKKNWNAVLDKLAAINAEAIIITPHFTVPSFMGNALPRGGEMRPQVRWLRQIARDRHVGLADTAARWAHLETEGIPYMTLEYNGINHPNDYGHSLFVKDLMTFFPVK